MSEWKWYGHPLHFICSYDCQFHLATELPSGYLVSTVGDYFPFHKRKPNSLLQADTGGDIGVDRKFETMVFKITGLHDCGCPDCDYCELDAAGYDTHEAATIGHMATCLMWEHGAPKDKE